MVAPCPLTTAVAAFLIAAAAGLTGLGLWVNGREQARLTGLRSGAIADLERAHVEEKGQRIAAAVSTLRSLVERLASEPSMADLARIAESRRSELDRQLRESTRRDRVPATRRRIQPAPRPGHDTRRRTLAHRAAGAGKLQHAARERCAVGTRARPERLQGFRPRGNGLLPHSPADYRDSEQRRLADDVAGRCHRRLVAGRAA